MANTSLSATVCCACRRIFAWARGSNRLSLVTLYQVGGKQQQDHTAQKRSVYRMGLRSRIKISKTRVKTSSLVLCEMTIGKRSVFNTPKSAIHLRARLAPRSQVIQTTHSPNKPMRIFTRAIQLLPNVLQVMGPSLAQLVRASATGREA